MATFNTPEPISLSVELGAGDVRITAEDRRDTVVEVRPSDPSKRSDVSAAERTVVEYAEGALVIRAPRRWAYTVLGAGKESVDVEIAVPAGSRLTVEAPGGAPAIHATGRLGDCHVRTGAGPIRLGAAGSVQLRTGVGDVTLDRVAGLAEVSTGAGAVRIGTIEGAAQLRTGAGDVTVDRVAGRTEVSTGAGAVRIGAIEGSAAIKGSLDTWIGEISGDLEVRAAYGGISVDRAEQAVVAKTSHGDVRLGEVARGAIVAQTGLGKVDVGVRTGVAAWLDLQTGCGDVLNGLEAAGPPQPGEETVEVRARSSFGDITVRRS
ncbi:MAG: DUF4097 family beta strand repeat-containing protein [Candidatus Dormibacteria bacterium]|jgi:DUF4097 and DUF4098 domain-containing protein YvlB